MPFQSVSVDHLYLIRWMLPTLVDARAVVATMQKMHKSLGRPLVFIAITPQESKLPPEETRTYMIANMSTVLQYCGQMLFVIEGSGFKNSIIRSVLTNILLLGKTRGRVTIHGTTEEAFRLLPEMGISLDRVYRAAQQARFPLPRQDEAGASP